MNVGCMWELISTACEDIHMDVDVDGNMDFNLNFAVSLVIVASLIQSDSLAVMSCESQKMGHLLGTTRGYWASLGLVGLPWLPFP